jgi:large subunit ribosomal protein L27
MAHKKGGGSSKNNRDSNAQRRGIKAYGGEIVTAGSIIARQCGTRWAPGKNVYLGKDYTVHAKIDGRVLFEKGGKQVSVWPGDVYEEKLRAKKAHEQMLVERLHKAAAGTAKA